MPSYPWEKNYTQYPPRGISSNNMDIVENPDTNPTLIGHTLAWCDEMEKALNEALTKAEGYFDELVAAGLRTKPKTTEELIQEQSRQQQEINAKLLEAISGLQKEISFMRNAEEGEKIEHKSDVRDSKGRFKSSQPESSTGSKQSATDKSSDTSL